MPLEPYERKDSRYWYARGAIEYNGRQIRKYDRYSTKSLTKAGAVDWIAIETKVAIQVHLLGEQQVATFNDAVVLYECDDTTSGYLELIVKEIGETPIAKITPKMIRDLGPKLYPNNATDTWRRWVIVPARAAILNAHDHGICPAIRVKGYGEATRLAQDAKRGKTSRQKKQPGTWEWLLKFRLVASPRLAALAFFMFATGARIGQAVAMRPDIHLAKIDEGILIVPGAKGRSDREVATIPELISDILDLTPRVPRGWARTKENLRVFGYASKDGPRKGWRTACRKADIPLLTPHAAGRHGFGQENVVRQGVDKPAVAAGGGWADVSMLDQVYTHGEDVDAKIRMSLRTGMVQAMENTGLKILKERE